MEVTAPAVDLYEEKDEIVVKAELPGIDKNNIEVNLTDHTLTIKGEKKKEEEITQTLDEPKDPPPAITADASKLVFFSTPLSAKGLLSAQIREAIKSLLSQTHGARIVKSRG